MQLGRMRFVFRFSSIPRSICDGERDKKARWKIVRLMFFICTQGSLFTQRNAKCNKTFLLILNLLINYSYSVVIKSRLNNEQAHRTIISQR